MWFQIISRLKINLGKSELVSVRDVLNIEALAGILRSKVSQLPMSYLRLPLGSTFKVKTVWNSVLDKLERRLDGKRCICLREGVYYVD